VSDLPDCDSAIPVIEQCAVELDIQICASPSSLELACNSLCHHVIFDMVSTRSESTEKRQSPECKSELARVGE
jgi:hypothetical protein